MDRTPPVTISNITENWNEIDEFEVVLTPIDYADTIYDTPSGIDKTYYTIDGSEPSETSLRNPHCLDNSTVFFIKNNGISSFYTVDGITPIEGTLSGPNSPDNTTRFFVRGEGDHVIKYFSIDNNGNKEYFKEARLKIDSKPPVSKHTVSFNPDGDNGWYKSNPTIILSSKDLISGVRSIFYRWGSNNYNEFVLDPNIPESEQTLETQIPSEGIHSLQYYAIDNAGNVEDAKTYFFKLDNKAPITQDDAPEKIQNKVTTVSFFTNDDFSGVKNTFFTIDGSTPTQDSTSGSYVSLVETGNYTIKYFSVDFAGNEEEIKEVNVKLFIDVEAPECFISESFPINGKNSWYRTSPEIYLSSYDLSGIKEIQYKLYPPNEITTAKYSSPNDISGSVDTTINSFIRLEIDQSGVPFEIDLKGVVPQQTTITEIITIINSSVGQQIAFETGKNGSSGLGYITLISPTAGTQNPISEIKFLKPLSNDITNTIFGLQETDYPFIFKETVVFLPYTQPILIPFDGFWQIEYFAIDQNNNQGEVRTKQYKLDTHGPKTNVFESFAPDGDNNWYKTTPEITLTTDDSLSGIFKILYKWDNGKVEDYTSGKIITIPSEGTHTLYFYSIDLAGNIEEQQSKIYRLDFSAPVTTDNTLEFQGIVFVSGTNGLEKVVEEVSTVINAYSIMTRNKNVKSVTSIFNITKNQEYFLKKITGLDRDYLEVRPFIKNENPTILSGFQIQLVGLNGSLLSNLDSVIRIFNSTKGCFYYVDYNKSTLDGNLFLFGEVPISLNDNILVDYYFDGVPLSLTDIVEVSYSFNKSHEVEVLNSLDYYLNEPAFGQYIHDHDVTIDLFCFDKDSGVIKTFYTIDGSEPTEESQEGTVIRLTENGNYTIKYFSIDAAGNKENVKTALYSIIIDKRIPELDVNTTSIQDGENGWFKKNFGLEIDITTPDFMSRFREELVECDFHSIKTGINDCIDFEEISGTELSCYIPEGVYTSQELASLIENAFNNIGSFNYSVYLEDSEVSEGQKFRFQADNNFNILWSTGTHKDSNLAITLGCGSNNPNYPTLDFVGSNDYISLYFKLKTKNYFIKSVSEIITSISDSNLICVEVSNGYQGFNDEILVLGNAPLEINIIENLIVDSFGSCYIYSLPIIFESLKIYEEGNPIPLESSRITYNSVNGNIIISNHNNNLNYTAHYSIKDKILIDYSHFIGIEKVKFGIDTLNLTTTIQVKDVQEYFLGIIDEKVVYKINLPTTSGQFFLKDGNHTLNSKAFDNNSVSNTDVPQKESKLHHLNFKLDRIFPITNDNVTNLDWQKAPVQITLTPFDHPTGSSVAETHFSIDGTNPTRLSPQGTLINFTNSGIFTLKYFSVDFAGNKEEIKTSSFPIKIDANAPVTSISTSPTSADGTNNWFITNPIVTFSVIDSHSGVFKTFYKINNEEFFTEYTSAFELTQQGINKITFYSIDNVGNIEEEKEAFIKIDTTSPQTTTNIISEFSSESIVRFSISDEFSGGDITYFTIDGTDPDLNSSSGNFIEFHVSGSFLIKYFSLDKAGNREETKQQEVYFDLEPPEIFDFNPENCIITEETNEISFRVKDSLSGIDINQISLDVDGIIYSTSKNSEYFKFFGDIHEYLIKIYPIENILNFQDIDVLRVRNVKDFAGNSAPLLEFNFSLEDSLGPIVKEVYPAPNTQDVSTESNIITFIDDYNSGVDIKSVRVSINGNEFKLNFRNILKIKYLGEADSVYIQIYNKTFSTFINGRRDVYLSFYDSNYDTIKKIEQYLNSLQNYSVEILDSRFEQRQSSLLLNENRLEIINENIINFSSSDENLNFTFIERESGYLVFINPNFRFEHKEPVKVTINASDNSGNTMQPFSYIFIPHIYATSSVRKRNYLNRAALDYLKDIQNNLASNYSRSRSTNFYGHQKAISLELARHLEEIDHLNEDKNYLSLRPQNLYTKLGYLLETKPPLGLSHDDYRRMLQSLIYIFSKGSLKTSLELGVQIFTISEIQIIEVVFSEGSDISRQFTFTADIIIGENKFVGLDIFKLSENLNHIFNLVKPAHVFIIQRFVWTELFKFQSGYTLLWEIDQFGNPVLDQFGNPIPLIAPDGFQAATIETDTAIFDRNKFFLDYTNNEDVRENCKEKLEKLQEFTDYVTNQFTGIEDYFYTYRSPILKNKEQVADKFDVIVTVDDIEVNVIEINPITGFIKIDVVPRFGQVVKVSYKYNQYFVFREFTFFLNDYSITGNNFSTYLGSIFNKENKYQVFGGIQIPEEDLKLHAHICETFYDFTLENYHDDIYEIPECNNRKFFYLNNYKLDNEQFDIENDLGSYLNDLETGNRSTKCPLLFLELDEKQKEVLEEPEESLTSIIIDGRENTFTSEIFIPIEDKGHSTSKIQYNNYFRTLDSNSTFDFHFGINNEDNIVEQIKIDEDVSLQFNGGNRDFIVSEFPIIKGYGFTDISNNINDIQIKINNIEVFAESVDGLTGQVYLTLPPQSTDIVTITYYYKHYQDKIQFFKFNFDEQLELFNEDNFSIVFKDSLNDYFDIEIKNNVNNKLFIIENEVENIITLSEGVYQPQELAIEIAEKLNLNSNKEWICEYSNSKFKIICAETIEAEIFWKIELKTINFIKDLEDLSGKTFISDQNYLYSDKGLITKYIKYNNYFNTLDSDSEFDFHFGMNFSDSILKQLDYNPIILDKFGDINEDGDIDDDDFYLDNPDYRLISNFISDELEQINLSLKNDEVFISNDINDRNTVQLTFEEITDDKIFVLNNLSCNLNTNNVKLNYSRKFIKSDKNVDIQMNFIEESKDRIFVLNNLTCTLNTEEVKLNFKNKFIKSDVVTMMLF